MKISFHVKQPNISVQNDAYNNSILETLIWSQILDLVFSFPFFFGCANKDCC